MSNLIFVKFDMYQIKISLLNLGPKKSEKFHMNNSPTKANAQANLEAGRYLCFKVGKSSFAIPLLAVREVIASTSTTQLPQMPTFPRNH